MKHLVDTAAFTIDSKLIQNVLDNHFSVFILSFVSSVKPLLENESEKFLDISEGLGPYKSSSFVSDLDTSFSAREVVQVLDPQGKDIIFNVRGAGWMVQKS